MDWKSSQGKPFNYFSYGAAVSEVEIDCLTGDHQVSCGIIYCCILHICMLLQVLHTYIVMYIHVCMLLQVLRTDIVMYIHVCMLLQVLHTDIVMYIHVCMLLQVLRTDIVMDVGKSLNPAIDIGQIEGGFIQGYGLFCLEQLKVMYTHLLEFLNKGILFI